MTKNFAFPTPTHQQAAETICAYFSARPQTDAVLLVNSCARGVATPLSDLDMAILVNPGLGAAGKDELENEWLQFYRQQPVFDRLRQLGRFSGVHLDLFDGEWTPEVWDEGGGPDDFEIAIGNQLVYSAPLWERGQAFGLLRARWLPYYDEALRVQRLGMVRQACQLNIARLEFYVGRGLYFQAFDRLYHAFQELLQAVFISRRVYPIAYNKWMREQIVDWLNLPALYAGLAPILQVRQLESPELIEHGQAVLRLLDALAAA